MKAFGSTLSFVEGVIQTPSRLRERRSLLAVPAADERLRIGP